jgi:hypothetical protein
VTSDLKRAQRSTGLSTPLCVDVWSYNFVNGRTRDGRTMGMLTLIDGYTRKCLDCESLDG